jgi:hypothetical protein
MAEQRLSCEALMTVRIADLPTLSRSHPLIVPTTFNRMFERCYRCVTERLGNAPLPFCAGSIVEIDQMNAYTVTCLWLPDGDPGVIEPVLRNQLGDLMDWPTEVCMGEGQERLAGKILSLGYCPTGEAAFQSSFCTSDVFKRVRRSQ